ncbi:hypothetical protein MMC26_003234 [Xylographa opegraphella]|nr:hypothetical protein [Xylographa opegraphella]
MDFLKSAVASAISKGPPFPYTFGDRVDLEHSVWTLYNGTKKEDGSNCSIFTFDITANKSRLPLVKNAGRKLKTLRHPGLIRVLDTVATETYVNIATERLTPLGWHIRRKSLSAETIKWGLYTVAVRNALKFVNDDAISVHGNVRASTIFTSESGEWRLGGLDILSSMKEDDAVIYTYAGLVPDINRCIPPEIAKVGWDAIKRNPVAAVDSYNFGLLIFEVFNNGLSGTDHVSEITNIPQSIQQSYKRLLNPNPKARLTVSHFLEQGRRSGGFFETPLIRLSEGIESLGLKSEGERAELLSELDEVSEDFPEEFFKMKILPELLKSVEFGGGGPKVLSQILKIGSKLSDEDYEARLNPVIIRLFASPDRQIRVSLLDSLPQMIDHLSQKVVTDKIFSQLVTGFTDLAPLVREQTVKSVLTIITKLSDRTINGDLLKCLAKTANDEQPGIRTNTTICLGKIARNLGTNTREKVLIAAFTRSLKDPFVHARNAALQALAATADLFPEDDCANRILPGLCSSLVDKEKIVRDQANRTFDVLMSRVRRYASTLPESILPPPTAGTLNGGPPRMGTPQTDTSWSGWAISSFTNKIASASGDIEAKSITNKPQTTSETRSASVPPTPSTDGPRSGNTTRTISDLHRKAVSKPSAPTLMRTPTEQFFQDAQAEDDEIDDAWAEMGDDSYFAAEITPAITTPRPFDDGGEPDFAGWLSSQVQAKAKAPLPKGLSRPSTSFLTNGQPSLTKVISTGSLGVGADPRKLAITPLKPNVTKPKIAHSNTSTLDTKPKESATDDDWGDAWD